jgi:cell division protein ZapE
LFHTIFLRDIPFLNINNRNELRRFIVLIDSLYEANVVVSILAPASPIDLLQVSADDKKNAVYDEVFAYDRTVSRLLEMSSLPYLEACHAKRPHELVTLASILEVDIDSKVAVNRR